MKQFFILLFATLLALDQAFNPLIAQLRSKPSCGPFEVDILNGTVDKIKPDFPIEQIREKYPCFTGIDSAKAKCGSALFYSDKGIKFYVSRQYVEIGPDFKGKLSIPLLGAQKGSLFKYLGNPKIKDIDWEAYEMSYGTLVVHYNSQSRVNLVQFSTKTSEVLDLCE
jgi:hypothetical protein